MNPSVFIDILNQENLSEFSDIKQLDRLLKYHPYFQIGLAAKSKYLKAEQHIDYVKTSRKTAVIFPDRAKLYQFLNQPELIKAKRVGKDESEEAVNLLPDHTAQNSIHTEEHEDQNDPENKKSDSITTDIPITDLEENYLVEAINQSIQLEASVYSIEDELKREEDPVVDKDEILSFSEWLTGKKNITPDRIHVNLIDEFIAENPVISPVQKKEFYSPVEKGKESISDSNLPISETLAAIFADQGNKEMAIKGYEKLMLKNPKKSAYFAALIKKIKES